MNTDVRVYVLEQTNPLALALARILQSDSPREVVVVQAPWAPAPQHTSPLSPRESEVAQLIRAGKSNRDIAGELFISERTVETHISSIFCKLNVNSRVQIATHSQLAC